MAKKKKKGCGLGRMNVGLIVLAVAMLALVANYALAGTTIRQEIVNLVAEKLLGQLSTDTEEPTLGFTAVDRSTFSGFNSINIKDELRFGDDTYNFTTDGWSEGYKVINLSATSSATVLNDTGETLYVYDSYIRIQTATTSNVVFEYLIGTSTAAYSSKEDMEGTSGRAAIEKTTPTTTTVVGDTYFKADFAGTDLLSLGALVVPVVDGAYIGCYASSSMAAETGHAAQCVVKYYTLDD